MREIKFKGKRIDDEGWFYGGFAIVENRPTIFANIECREVVPETVGQYTGLKDKNGKEIYEGDKVHCWGGETCQGYSEYDVKFIVNDIRFDSMQLGELENIEVIGNIYDNPELLEKVGNKEFAKEKFDESMGYALQQIEKLLPKAIRCLNDKNR